MEGQREGGGHEDIGALKVLDPRPAGKGVHETCKAFFAVVQGFSAALQLLGLLRRPSAQLRCLHRIVEGPAETVRAEGPAVQTLEDAEAACESPVHRFARRGEDDDRRVEVRALDTQPLQEIAGVHVRQAPRQQDAIRRQDPDQPQRLFAAAGLRDGVAIRIA